MDGNLQEPVKPSPTQSAYAQNESSAPSIKGKSKYGTWLLFFALFLWLLFILVSFWFIFMRGGISQALKDAAFTIIMIGIYYPFVARFFKKASDFTKSIILLGGLTIVFVSGFIWVRAYESANVHLFIKNYGMRILFLTLSAICLFFGILMASKRFRAFWYNSQENFLSRVGVSKHYINTEARANRALVEKSGIWNNKFLAVTCVILGVLGSAVSIPLFFTSTSLLTFPHDNIDNQSLNQPQQQVQQPTPSYNNPKDVVLAIQQVLGQNNKIEEGSSHIFIDESGQPYSGHGFYFVIIPNSNDEIHVYNKKVKEFLVSRSFQNTTDRAVAPTYENAITFETTDIQCSTNVKNKYFKFGCGFSQNYLNQQVIDQVRSFYKNFATGNLSRDSLIGIWMDGYVLGSGWSDRYQFYKSGTYAFIKNQMDCEDRERGEMGLWQLEEDMLKLTAKVEVYLEGGQLNFEPGGSCATKGVLLGATVKSRTLSKPKEVELQLRPNPNDPEPDFYYPSTFIGKYRYWKYYNPLESNPPFELVILAPTNSGSARLYGCGPDNDPCIPEK